MGTTVVAEEGELSKRKGRSQADEGETRHRWFAEAKKGEFT